jgi:hypothetical protein
VTGGPAGRSPVVVLSYAYSGAQHVQEALAAGTGLASTAATGIIPLCEAAGETWRRVEGRGGQALSRLAVSSIRGMVSAQVALILADAGKSRWCELATAPSSALGAFLEVFPGADVVCVHRASLDVIRDGVRANPWGLQGQGFLPYLLAHPGNSVAALAAYWARSAEDLLAFEAENPKAAHRIHSEDVAADPVEGLRTLKVSLGLRDEPPGPPRPGRVDLPERGEAPGPAVPMEMIPKPLRERIVRLHAELGYSPPHLRRGVAQPTDLHTGPNGLRFRFAPLSMPAVHTCIGG